MVRTCAYFVLCAKIKVLVISFAYYGIATPFFFRAPSVNRVCQEKGISVENYLITQLKTISAKRKLNFEIVHQYVCTL